MSWAALALALLASAAAAWRLGPGAYQRHLDAVTGHPGTKVVSCWHCHHPAGTPVLPAAGPAGVRYLSPQGLAVSPDGKTLFVAAEGADRLLQVDLDSRRVTGSVELAGRPHGVAVSRDGRRVAVSCRDRDLVVLLDAATLEERGSVPTGGGPLGVAWSPDGGRVYAVEGGADAVRLADPDGKAPARDLPAGRSPYALALSRDGRTLAVANLLSNPASSGTVPVSELTVIDASEGRVRERRPLFSAQLSEGVALASDASFALAPAVRVRNLLPTTEVARGGLMNGALVLADLRSGRTAQFPLDEVNAYFADPAGIALTPDDRTAFIVHGGADLVTAVDVAALRRWMAGRSQGELDSIADDLGASSRYVLGRVRTLQNPRAAVLSPDGRRLYVSERLADSVAVIDVATLRLAHRIPLGGPAVVTALRRGERRFHNASGTFQGQFSCRSCHPDGGMDGLTWDFEIDGLGKEVVDSMSLAGIRATAPFKWRGKNPTLSRQCGPRFSRVLMRADPFPPDQLAELVAYIESIPPRRPRRDAETAEAAARGKALFLRTRTNRAAEIAKRDRCGTCHTPPLYTIRLPFDVGTGGKFDTPYLGGIRYTAPYLHDDRAASLEEIWTVHNSSDAHGVSSDMTKAQLNDLVTFLRSL